MYITYIIIMTSSTSTLSYLNVIIIINILSSQYHHQHHLISMIFSTSTSSHINIIININIISYHHYHKHQHYLISMLSMSSVITLHIYIHKFLCMGFTLLNSLDNTSLIQQQYHSQFQSSITNKPHPISQKHSFLENQHTTGTNVHHYSLVP